MKILQIHNKVPYPPKDGGSIAVFNLSKGFAQNGISVKLLCFNTKKHYVNLNEEIKTLPEISIETVDINTDLKISGALKNLFFSKLPYNAQRFISEEFSNKLAQTLKNETFDIIQIEGLYMMPYVQTIRKLTKTPIAYRAHNIEHEIWENTLKNEKNTLKKYYLKIISKRLKKFETSYLNKYDFLIPITKRDNQIFTNLGNHKPSHVTPTGINISEYTHNISPANELSLFYLGALDWAPNQEGLIWFLEKIWPEIKNIDPNISFTIAGRNAPKNLEKYFLSQNINYCGETENALKFIQKHSIMIVPLLSGGGMRIKILEGMAAKKLIITTSKGAEGINAENFKHIIIADNPDEFAAAIKTVTQNKSIIKEISFAAHKYISENFDNFALSKSLIDFYKNSKI